jgi:AAA domain/VirE N-terminal domain/Primase C terminal 1 (PriCT-1)
MQDESISLGSATSNGIAGHTTPAAIIADVQSGKWAVPITALRAATGDEADRLKKLLPGILWAGTFTSRKNDGIETFSGYLCADIDKVSDRIGELHAKAKQDPHAAAAFVSPSGTGIKIVFRVPVAADGQQHRQHFNAVRAHVAKIYGAKVDEAAKDVARLCFVSRDPDAFFKADAVPLDVRGELPVVASVQSREGAEKGGRNNAAFELACECRDKGQTPAEAKAAVRDFAAQCNPPLAEAEANACVKSAFSQSPRPRVVESPDLIDAADFLAMPIDPPAELITGILHKGSKLAFGGSSKSFKTWSLLDVAISVATGTEWLGRATAQGKVLFVNFEIQPHQWQCRISKVARAKGVELIHGKIILWNLRGYAADFKKLIPQIIERARLENFALIILDPIYKLYGNTDENSAGNVALLLNSLENLAMETGAAIAFGAHFAKGNAASKEAIDRISGSGVFARDPDSLLIFTKHETDDAFTVEPILRNFAPVAPFAIRWQFPLMHRDDDLDPAKLKQAGGRPAKHCPADLLALLPPDGLDNKAWLEAARAKTISERTFYRLRRDLENTDKILESVAAGKWLPTLPKAKA